MYDSIRLVEETEAHVVVRLLLLLSLLLSRSLLSGSSTTRSGSTTRSSGTTSTTRRNRSKLLATLSDELKRALVLWSIASPAFPIYTSLMSLPSSSEMSLSRRSWSASIPTDSRTALTSSADGEALPPRPRRRYAARCFILICSLFCVSFLVLFQQLFFLLDDRPSVVVPDIDRARGGALTCCEGVKNRRNNRFNRPGGD